MTPEQREELKAAAMAASPGPWNGDRYDGTVKYELRDVNDNAVIRGDNGNSGGDGYGIMNYEDEVYLKATNPSAILSLIAQVEALTVPQVAVSVERGGVYIIKGVQSFRLAYEGETRAEQEWYAGVLRKALAAPTIPAIPGTKEAEL